jgi:diketogulonate reductase-like aldo/keto reductase
LRSSLALKAAAIRQNGIAQSELLVTTKLWIQRQGGDVYGEWRAMFNPRAQPGG